MSNEQDKPEDLPVPPGSAPDAGAPAAPPAPPLVGAFANLNLAGLDSGDSDDDDEELLREEEDDGGMVLLPPAIARRVGALKALHERREEIFEDYKAARCALEEQFRTRYDGLYKERADIVTGVKEIAASEAGEPDVAADQEEEEAGGDMKGVPQFWVQAMMRHAALADLVEEPDLDVLASISDIKCIDREDLLGFTLEFHFSTNEYFSNAVLTKTYVTAEILDYGEPLLEKVEGCDIDWKKGKNLCEKTIKQKQGGRNRNRSGPPKVVTKTVKTDSFFKFFMTPVMQEMEDEEEEEEPDHYELTYEIDYEVALVFRNHIIPNAVMWFTGEALSDDEEDEEGDEDDEQVQEVSGNAAAAVLLTGAPADAENPECKQS